MILAIPDVLLPEQVTAARQALEPASGEDSAMNRPHGGSFKAGSTTRPTGNDPAEQIGGVIMESLGRTPLFMSAALPLHILPPIFHRQRKGEPPAREVEAAVRDFPGLARRIRLDLSCTLFITDPDDYDGGELVIEGAFGRKRVKLPAGGLILYPAASLRHIEPVTQGARLSSSFSVQSMVRDHDKRSLLFEIDTLIQRLRTEHPGDPGVTQLRGIYHNLLRQWAEVA